jgi:hypothetical protein
LPFGGSLVLPFKGSSGFVGFFEFAFGAHSFLIRIAFGALVLIAFGERSLSAFGAGSCLWEAVSLNVLPEEAVRLWRVT